MNFKGKAVKLGDHINTDLIIAAKYTKTLDMDELAEHVFEDLDSSLKNKLNGSIVVAGDNFGGGSSREQAPLALKHAGVKALVANSFARIFFRNTINIGLPAVEADTTEIEDEDMIEIDLKGGEVLNLTRDKKKSCSILSDLMVEILKANGLTNYLKSGKTF